MVYLVVKLIDGYSERYDAMPYDVEAAAILYRSGSVGGVCVQSGATKEVAIAKGILQFAHEKKKIRFEKMPNHGHGLLAQTIKDMLIDTLRMCGWVQKDAAEYLGITPRIMNFWINKYGINPPDLAAKWRRKNMNGTQLYESI